MEPHTFEGTWEEVARYAAELAGRRVRLTVLDPAPLPPTLETALAESLEEAQALAASRPSTPGLTWEEGVIEKFRRQGFAL